MEKDGKLVHTEGLYEQSGEYESALGDSREDTYNPDRRGELSKHPGRMNKHRLAIPCFSVGCLSQFCFGLPQLQLSQA